MTTHHERIPVPFKPQDMYDLVLDVTDYPRFIPWVQALRVRSDENKEGLRLITADMVVKYSVFRETFRSEVTADPEAYTIDVRYVKGPLQNLANHWRFEGTEEGCVVDFKLDFAFKNRLMQAAANAFVDHGFKRLSGAFIDEAHRRYPQAAAKAQQAQAHMSGTE
ncbi:MAG: type II toxin-antitoxin system RatA family toxin [Pseudomonadota bacterium]